ncbi:hypothetical protein [Nonomuraea jiangxiensis]|uniref:hypothetical protein n=1 Tax=Nonomuraea jiangxiensis TaxID=633440 RepID=UPI000B89B4C8|nr:hypothetical protein [Nonomuraea jiangxiensis]
MEPVTLIVAALVAGAAAGTQGVVTTAVTDAYEGLKALVRARLPGGREVGDDPEELTAELERVQAGDDPALVAAARKVMTLLDAEGARAAKYQVNAPHAMGVQIGDNTTQTNTFHVP